MRQLNTNPSWGEPTSGGSHPEPRQLQPFEVPDEAKVLGHITFSASDVSKAVKHAKGSSGGTSGLNADHLWAAMGADAGLVDAVTALINLFGFGKLPHSFLIDFLTLISKDNGDIRPILIGDIFFRLASALHGGFLPPLVASVDPCQFGVSVSGGAEKIAWDLRECLSHPDNLVIAIDLKNAFNSIERGFILDFIDLNAPALSAFYRAVLTAPSVIVAADGSLFDLTTGGRQGDPSMSALFSIGLGMLFRACPALDQGILRYSFLDDIYLALPRALLPVALNWLSIFARTASEFGLSVNWEKTAIFFNGGGGLVNMPPFQHDIVCKNVCQEVVTILGVPFCTEQDILVHAVADKLGKVAMAAEAVADIGGVPDAQLCHTLYRLSISHMSTFLCRTMPPSIMRDALALPLPAGDLVNQLDDAFGDDSPHPSSGDRLQAVIGTAIGIGAGSTPSATPNLRRLVHLPLRMGGAGYRLAEDLSVPAFLASSLASSPTCPASWRGPLSRELELCSQSVFGLSANELRLRVLRHFSGSGPGAPRAPLPSPLADAFGDYFRGSPPRMAFQPAGISDPVLAPPPQPSADHLTDFSKTLKLQRIQKMLQQQADDQLLAALIAQFGRGLGNSVQGYVDQLRHPFSFAFMAARPVGPLRIPNQTFQCTMRTRFCICPSVSGIPNDYNGVPCLRCKQVIPRSADMPSHAEHCPKCQGNRTKIHYSVRDWLVSAARQSGLSPQTEVPASKLGARALRPDGTPIEHRIDLVMAFPDEGVICYDFTMTCIGPTDSVADSFAQATASKKWEGDLLSTVRQHFQALVMSRLGLPADPFQKLIYRVLGRLPKGSAYWQQLLLSCKLASHSGAGYANVFAHGDFVEAVDMDADNGAFEDVLFALDGLV
jgi:hypothetical protein